MKWSEQLGPKLQTTEGLQDTDDRLAGKKVVGFYFNGPACPEEYYTALYMKDLYQNTIMAYPEFELVFISSDSDRNQYNKYFELLKFPAIPFDERATIEALITEFGFPGYKTKMVFFNGEGKVIDPDGQCTARNSRGDGYHLWEALMRQQYPDNYWVHQRSRYGNKRP